ncbi:MAG: nucleotidyl transferase AbiEii/AbiGii toxin family protein [Candidatus Omnitrophota bacterium]
MLSKKYITELAQKYQTTETNIAREYCQHLFLSYFYQKKNSNQILFKGGTALRIIYNSPRFSEDLDFSAFNIKLKMLEDIFLNSIVDIENTGIKAEIKEAKPTSGGYLGIAYFNFLDFREAIQVEVSLRSKKIIKPEINLINASYAPPFNIASLPQKLLIEEKIEALLSRAKPRDFFDLYFILRSDFKLTKNTFKFSEILKKLDKTTIDFKIELKMLLPKSHHIILKDFRNIFRREIEKFI